jgi:hypothetical protein
VHFKKGHSPRAMCAGSGRPRAYRRARSRLTRAFTRTLSAGSKTAKRIRNWTRWARSLTLGVHPHELLEE